MSSEYRVASPFLIRLAGAPFDLLEGLATPKTSAAGREVLSARQRLEPFKAAAQEFVTRRDNGLSPEDFHAWKSALRKNVAVPNEVPPALQEYAANVAALASAESDLDREFVSELRLARQNLHRDSKRILPPYLLFASAGTQHLFIDEEGEVPARNSRERERERHLLLYLQRVAAKNDTFSEFGPSAWGTAGATGGKHVKFAARAGVARREAFLERWTAHALAAGMNADPEVFAELIPRLNPNGVISADRFIATDTGQSLELTPDQQAFLQKLDGATPVHLLGDESVAHELAERGVILCRVEVPAFESHAVPVLAADVRKWREGAARTRWSQNLDRLEQLPIELANATSPEIRAGVVNDTRDHFNKIGAERAPGGRALYAAVNPIGEECFRECTFEVGAELLDEVTRDAAPWIDLWRDTYAFVAGRVAGNLRSLLEKAPVRNGSLPLPAFLRFCEAANVSLTGPGLVGMAHIAFQEVKAAFRARLQPHRSLSEYQLTPDDCHVVRHNFEYAKFDEYTYPSADLQLAASSTAAIDSGDYQWIVSELHPPVAALHHCMYWSCPDQAALSSALEAMVNEKPSCHFGFFAADFTAHTALRNFNALPKLTNFVAPQRADPAWRYVAPAQAEVFVDESSGDVAIRHTATHEYLGSFARAWLIPLGFHPFQFTVAPQNPRLLCGDVVVQRRAWTVTLAELGGANFQGVSRELVLAVERLRAARELPRFVYVRPTEQALRRAGAVGRDKDTKPIFVDLESYLSLEIFYRWLTKADELEVTEMLPTPDQLLWREVDGRRTFELRTLITPRA